MPFLQVVEGLNAVLAKAYSAPRPSAARPSSQEKNGGSKKC